MLPIGAMQHALQMLTHLGRIAMIVIAVGVIVIIVISITDRNARD